MYNTVKQDIRKNTYIMNIIIISHERSLNKAEGLLNAYINDNVTLVIERPIHEEMRPYIKLAKRILISKTFNPVDITKKISQCDKVWCVSENLLPVQSQLESYYKISNISPFAAEVLSNKQNFDDYCRSIGLGEYVPNSVTPVFHNQLDVFQNKEIFSKPDIGTGSNVFFPGDDQNTPNIEYRRWNNRHHFLKYLKDKKSHNEFFDINKQGIYTERFNFKSCRIMFQEYFWSQEPTLSPIGFVKDGIVNITCYLKTTKVKYGDILDPFKTPVQSHSNSKNSDIAKDLAVWITSNDEVDMDKHQKIESFLQSLVSNLNIKELFFAGPDFHIYENRLIAIDFNPRPGQFMNILDQIESNNVINAIINNTQLVIKNKLLWGCAALKPGKIAAVKDLSHLEKYFNKQNTVIKEGMVIPQFQNLQNKAFNINLNITGNNEQELFDRYRQINKLLQDCIVYE